MDILVAPVPQYYDQLIGTDTQLTGTDTHYGTSQDRQPATLAYLSPLPVSVHQQASTLPAPRSVIELNNAAISCPQLDGVWQIKFGLSDTGSSTVILINPLPSLLVALQTYNQLLDCIQSEKQRYSFSDDQEISYNDSLPLEPLMDLVITRQLLQASRATSAYFKKTLNEISSERTELLEHASRLRNQYSQLQKGRTQLADKRFTAECMLVSNLELAVSNKTMKNLQHDRIFFW